jgi:DNA repair protein RadC
MVFFNLNHMETKVNEVKVTYRKKYVSNQTIRSSFECWKLFKSVFNKNTIELVEEMNVLLLDLSNHPIGIFRASLGGTRSAIVDIKLILSIALKCMAHGIIISHNHPSGKALPSEEDLKVTKDLQSACSIVGINLLDHIIITSEERYFSFSDEGLM